MSDQDDFASLLGEFEKSHPAVPGQDQPQVGDRVSGTLVSIQGDTLFIDLGAKTEGVMEADELRNADGDLEVKVGDTIETQVSGIDQESGALLLGSRHARHVRGVEGLRQAFEEQAPVEGRVTGTTKGGIEVEVSGVRAFCPASQVDLHFVEELESLVGEKLAFRITRMEGGRHPNLVLSRRALLEEEQRIRAAETRQRLEVGAVLTGTVTGIRDFGAFVDLGGIEGLIHVSELSFGRVGHPGDLLTKGQVVEVAVLRIEQSDDPRHPERIALSMRALEQDPWQEAASAYPVGSRVEGTVVRLQPFGAFVEIAPGIDGLVHVSELGAGRRVGHPQEVVSLGERVQATVLGIDVEKRRLALSLDTEQLSQVTPERQRAPASDRHAPPAGSMGTLGDLFRETLEKRGKE